MARWMAPPTVPSPGQKRSSSHPGSTSEVPSPVGALTKMKLPVPPRAWLLQGLLGLMLLLVAVHGVAVKKPPSPRVLFRKPPAMVESLQENVETGKDQQLEGTARPASTPDTPSSTNIGVTFRPTLLDAREGSPVRGDEKEAPSMAEHKGPQGGGHTQEEDAAEEKPGMSIGELREHIPELKDVFDQPDADRCDKWLSSNNHTFMQFLLLTLQTLPSCPCEYPDEAQAGEATVFDQRLNSTARWKDASDAEQHVLAYHPTAQRCLRSLRAEHSRTLGAQLCCYNRRGLLLTRGKGAGSPELISPYVSADLHFILNRFPWVSCKGDWSRYQEMLPPNNGLSCPPRPAKNKYAAQMLELSKN